tara:strand:+ start:1357 stop:2778 length:1422 start_codon:yes stop_codon:yes gene_type:complete
LAVIHKSDDPESLLDLWCKESDDIFQSKRVSDSKSAFGDFVSGDTRCLAVEYSYIQYYKPNNPPITLLAIYFRHDDTVYFTITASNESLRTGFSELPYSLDAIENFICINDLPILLLGAPLTLETVYIDKPWGHEIWYTGIEERGVSCVTDGTNSTPLPWVLSAAPNRLAADREKQINLLKILDPLPDSMCGDLYFELHEKKQEAYVVVDINKDSWPNSIGGVRYGFDDELRRTFSSKDDFYFAYKKAVEAYRTIRKTIDNQLDVYRQKEGFLLDEALPTKITSKWIALLPEAWVSKEKELRAKMDYFTSILPVKVGDVVKIPLLTPHGLLHGVRVVEFQTPVYERLIISFNQKTLTQNHWDTDKALNVMTEVLDPPPILTVIQENSDYIVEEVAVFKDFRVSRITIMAQSSYRLPIENNYRLLLVIKGNVDCSGVLAEKECGLFLPADLQDVNIQNHESCPSILLLASPICE